MRGIPERKHEVITQWNIKRIPEGTRYEVPKGIPEAIRREVSEATISGIANEFFLKFQKQK